MPPETTMSRKRRRSSSAHTEPTNRGNFSPPFPTNQSNSPRPLPRAHLLSLPLELRLIIYEHLFPPPAEKDFAARGDEKVQFYPPQRASDFLAPLLTCRLIYQEALGTAFKNAIFTITVKEPRHPHAIFPPQVCQRLPDWKIQLVRHVRVTLRASELWSYCVPMGVIEQTCQQLAQGPFKLACLAFSLIFEARDAYNSENELKTMMSVAKLLTYDMSRINTNGNVEKIVFPYSFIHDWYRVQVLFEWEVGGWVHKLVETEGPDSILLFEWTEKV